MIVNIIYSTIQHPHAFDSKKNHQQNFKEINYFLPLEILSTIHRSRNNKKRHLISSKKNLLTQCFEFLFDIL
jgi:hypothetical protein